ncbi:REP-associated tyrosine transposase [Endothiovibrio diazotrophicus]
MDHRPHGRNLRKGRVSETGRIYLVTTITIGRRPLFADLSTGREVVKAMQCETKRAETLAFVVMPDHLHWLLQLRERVTLERAVRNVKAFSAQRINRREGNGGPVWQRGFHDHALRREEELVKLARYVVANPLRAGLVTRIGDYPLWDAIWL